MSETEKAVNADPSLVTVFVVLVDDHLYIGCRRIVVNYLLGGGSEMRTEMDPCWELLHHDGGRRAWDLTDLRIAATQGPYGSTREWTFPESMFSRAEAHGLLLPEPTAVLRVTNFARKQWERATQDGRMDHFGPMGWPEIEP